MPAIPERVALTLKRRSLILEIVLAPLTMAALFLFAYGKFLHGDKSIATFQDNTYFYLPLFSHISRSFAHGDYPYWINTLMGGLPLFDNPNFSLIYPFYFFHSGLYTNPATAILQLHYVAFLHLFIAYVNCYVLLRILRVAVLPALLGASIFVFSPNMFGYAVWIAIIAAYSWFPLVIAGVVLILENRRPRIGILLGSLSLSLLILATPAQALIHAVYFMAVLFGFSAIQRWKANQQKTLLVATRNLLLMGALTLLFSAPVLVPVLVDMKNMIRFAGVDAPAIGYGRLSYHATLNGQLDPRNLAGTLLPYAVPSLIGNCFVGIGAVFLALFASFRARSHWIVPPFMLVTLYALLSSTGSHLGLSLINYCLPLLNKFREPDRHLFVFVFGISVLAALGFGYLVEVLSSSYRKLLDLKHLAVVVTTFGLLIFSVRSGLPYIGLASKTAFLLGSGFALLPLVLLPFIKGRGRQAVAAVVVFLIIFAGFLYPKNVLTLPDGDYFSAQNLASHRVLEELARLEDVSHYRIMFADEERREQKWAMNATYYDLRTFYLYCNIVPYQQFEEMYLSQIKASPYSLLLGAKYYLCSRCERPPLDGYVLNREINGYKLYVNDQALPRYSVVTKILGAYESSEEFLARVNAGYDFRNEAYVPQSELPELQAWLGKPESRAAYQIKEEYSSLNRARLRVDTDAPAILLLNEYFHPAWQSSVNGKRVAPVKLNLNQIGVLIEKGSNVVEFEYRPLLYVWFLRIQQVAMVILFVSGLVLAFRYFQRARHIPGA